MASCIMCNTMISKSLFFKIANLQIYPFLYAYIKKHLIFYINTRIYTLNGWK